MLRNILIFLPFAWFCFIGGGCKKRSFNSEIRRINEQEKALEFKAFNKFNLEYLALGKNRMEVESLMGPPDGRSLGNEGEYLWDYRRPVLDDQTGKVYDWSLITFRFNQGVCSSINFQLSKRPVQLSETDQQPL